MNNLKFRTNFERKSYIVEYAFASEPILNALTKKYEPVDPNKIIIQKIYQDTFEYHDCCDYAELATTKRGFPEGILLYKQAIDINEKLDLSVKTQTYEFLDDGLLRFTDYLKPNSKVINHFILLFENNYPRLDKSIFKAIISYFKEQRTIYWLQQRYENLLERYYEQYMFHNHGEAELSDIISVADREEIDRLMLDRFRDLQLDHPSVPVSFDLYSELKHARQHYVCTIYDEVEKRQVRSLYCDVYSSNAATRHFLDCQEVYEAIENPNLSVRFRANSITLSEAESIFPSWEY